MTMYLNILKWNTNRSDSLRKRSKDVESPDFTLLPTPSRKTQRLPPLQSRQFLAVLLFLSITFLLVVVIEKRLPRPLTISEEPENPHRFIAERAFNFLKKLTEIGPRLAGSYANEVLAVELLTSELKNIIKDAHEDHVIELDLQTTSGDFNLGFLDGMTNVYRDLQNIVVKFGSRNSSGHSLLLNCHFDSALDSPGASDDGAGCAVMLETLRVLSLSPESLPHSIIFLFNGGEENYLPASHGFITQHKWAKQVRAFINLEACGAGGREFLFQAGPHHPWILETYSRVVPYPYASSAAKEIFQSGIIPADTDYRIFRDFGNVSGVDFAWSVNGYVYHSRFDTIDQIPMGSLQRTGDNILALVKGMAGGHQLGEGEKYKEGDLVFFDVLGAFIVRMSMGTARVFTLIIVLVSLIPINRNANRARKSHGLDSKRYYRKLWSSILTVLGSWAISIVTNIVIALFLTMMGKTMSWYTRPWWIFFLYIIPAASTYMTRLLSHSRNHLQDAELSCWTLFQLYYDATQLIWTGIVLLGLIFGTHFFCAALVWVLFSFIGNFLNGERWNAPKWLVLHMGVITLPFIQCSYWILAILYLFIPILGRIGAGNHGEILLAVIITALFMLLFSFVAPLVLLVRQSTEVLRGVKAVFLFSMVLLFITSLGFPYSDDPNSLAPQRFMIAHSKRTFHDFTGDVAEEKSGFWVVDMDSNSLNTVKEFVPEAALAEDLTQDCKDYLYCGVPYLVSALSFYWKTHWIPGPEPEFQIATTVNFTKKSIDGGVRVGVDVQGATQMAVMISPVLGVEIKGWSLESRTPLEGPRWNGRETYFVYYAHGLKSVPLNFTMDFKVPKAHSGFIMDIAVCSQFLFGPGKSSSKFSEFIQKFPSWTAVAHWTATYESWVI